MPRCVVVLADGLRPDAIGPGRTPTLAGLGDDYTQAVRAMTIRPSVTVAALASLATGVSPDTHGLVEPGLGFLSRLGRLRPLPTELARHGLTTSVVAGLANAAARHATRALTGCAGVTRMITTAPDAAAVIGGASGLFERREDGLLFLYLSDCDRAGHEDGWMSPRYLEAVRRVDAAVGALTARLGDAHLIVVADHGGGGVSPRDHDTPHPVNDHIPVILAGPRVRRRYLIHEEVSLLDVPPTVMALLGVPAPREYEGRVLQEALMPAQAGAAA